MFNLFLRNEQEKWGGVNGTLSQTPNTSIYFNCFIKIYLMFLPLFLQ